MTTSPATISREISRERLARAAGALPWVLAVAVIAYAFVAGGYLVTVVSFALIYAVFVTGLNLFMGYAGQVSFGHNAFAALAGYASAVLTATYGWAPLAAFAVVSQVETAEARCVNCNVPISKTNVRTVTKTRTVHQVRNVTRVKNVNRNRYVKNVTRIVHRTVVVPITRVNTVTRIHNRTFVINATQHVTGGTTRAPGRTIAGWSRVVTINHRPVAIRCGCG